MNNLPVDTVDAPSSVTGSAWQRLATDLRLPAVVMVVLAVGMNVAFPLWRVAAGREGYILHLSDDSFYYFSVAPHIAAGEGPTADGVTRTTGWHPLYGFLLAGLYWLTGPSLDGFVKQAIALNAVLYLLSGYVLYLAGKRWWGRTAGVAAALLWLTSAYGTIIAAMGLETAAYALCLALLLWRLAAFLKPAETPTGGSRRHLLECVAVGLCAGLAVLGRTDSILLMPFVAMILLFGGRERQVSAAGPGWGVRIAGVGIFGLLALAAYGAWIGYVWHYTHELNQGSAAVKMEWRKFLMQDKSLWGMAGFALAMLGDYLLAAFVKVSALKWVITGVPLLLHAAQGRAERWLIHLLWVTPVVLGAAYALLLDWARGWYVAPALLTLTLLSAGAAAALRRAPAEGDTPPAGPPWLGALQRLARNHLGLIAWAVILESGIVFGVVVAKEFDSKSEKLLALRVAAWLEKHAEPHARIGCWHSGIIGYYSPKVDVINLDGLNNNDILPILRGDRLLNPFWDRINLVGLIPSGDVNYQTGEVGKMGRFNWAWGHKKLVKWRDAPGFNNAAPTLDIYEQAIPQRVYRVVPTTQPGAEVGQ